MKTQSVKVTENAMQQVNALSDSSGMTKQAVIERAIGTLYKALKKNGHIKITLPRQRVEA
jgi:hypothetical protein